MSDSGHVTSHLIEVQGLNKSYRSGQQSLHVLRNLDLCVPTGSMTAILGVSGSGKSTLLHIIGGMERPDRGKVLYEGRDLTRLDVTELAAFRNREIGFVFQFHHLLPEFTALENTAFPLWLRAGRRDSELAHARAVLEEVGLGDRLDHRPGELSGGEQQRVAIARALVGQPRLVLADEPTGNLDPSTASAIHRLLHDLQRQRKLSVVVVTHNAELASLCDSQKRLQDGKLV